MLLSIVTCLVLYLMLYDSLRIPKSALDFVIAERKGKEEGERQNLPYTNNASNLDHGQATPDMEPHPTITGVDYYSCETPDQTGFWLPRNTSYYPPRPNSTSGPNSNPNPDPEKISDFSLPPFVTITTATRGEWQFERNVWWNVRYSTYPPDRMELLIVDSSSQPSEFFRALINSGKHAHPKIKYLHYPTPKISMRDMWVGNARNVMTKEAKGDILVSMDSDDVYPPTYVAHMVKALMNNTSDRREERTEEFNSSLELVAQNEIRYLVLHPSGSWTISDLQSSASMGGHHIAYCAKIPCHWMPFGSSEEVTFFRCSQARKTYKRIETDEKNAMIKVRNPVSVTNQLFYQSREIYTPLSVPDWYQYLLALEAMYAKVHEELRPACVRAENFEFLSVPSNSSSPPMSIPKPNTGPDHVYPGNATASTSHTAFIDDDILALSEERGVGESEGRWQRLATYFHEPCRGFSRLPGFQIKREMKWKTAGTFQYLALNSTNPHDLGETLNEALARQGERQCCKECLKSGNCTVFEYEVATGACIQGIKEKEEPCARGDKMCGISLVYMKPESLLTHATGVRNEDCERCARKTKMAVMEKFLKH